MRTGTPLEWAQLLGVGPDDLPAQTRKLVRGIEVLDEATIQLRVMLHGCPDRELSEALLQLERRVGDVVAMIRELHREVVRELS